MSNVNNVSGVLFFALSFKVVGPLAQFLKEIGVVALPDTSKVYRDTKTGKFVSYKVILDLFDSYNGKSKVEAEAFIDQNEDSVTDEDNKIGEVFASALSTVDVLPALPNWESMTLEEILLKCAYHKKSADKGVSNNTLKVALTQIKFVREGANLSEKEVLIPVRGAGDGGEYTRYDASGGEDPETVSLTAAAKARAKIEEWQANGEAMGLPTYRIEEIDAWIGRLRGGVSETEIHPFLDGEDVAESLYQQIYLIKWEADRAKRSDKIAKMRFVFEGMPAGGLKVKNLENIAWGWAGDAIEKMAGKFDIEVAGSCVYEASKSWVKDESTGEWMVLKDTVMGYILSCFRKKYGKEALFNGASLHKSEIVREGVKALMWNCICSEPKLQHDAVKGTISRYVGHMLNVLEVTEVRQDKQRRSIGIDASPAWKTVYNENIVPEKGDYLWNARWLEEEEYEKSDLTSLEVAFALGDIQKIENVKGKNRAMVVVGKFARWVTDNE